MAIIRNSPSALVPASYGSVVSETLLRGYACYTGIRAHYMPDNTSAGLTNRCADGLSGRPAAGTNDLIVQGSTPARGANFATVSPSAGYDSALVMTIPFTVMVFFSGRKPNGQFVVGTGGVNASNFSIRTEIAGGAERVRCMGANGSDYFPTFSGEFPDPWRCVAMSVSATQRIDYVPQKDEDVNGLNYNLQAGSFAISASPTLHLGAAGVFTPGGYSDSVSIADLMVFNVAKTATELDDIYGDTLLRMLDRGIAIPPV